MILLDADSKKNTQTGSTGHFNLESQKESYKLKGRFSNKNTNKTSDWKKTLIWKK